MRGGLASALLVGALVTALATGCAHHTAGTTDSLAGSVQRGRALFVKTCANCHGPTGVEGGMCPSLRGERRRKDLDATIVWIHYPQPPMPTLYPAPLTDAEVVDIASYVQTL